ncbi:MAG: hypothetical protein QM635_04040, partial [Microbacteriaceae bacterium]
GAGAPAGDPAGFDPAGFGLAGFGPGAGGPPSVESPAPTAGPPLPPPYPVPPAPAELATGSEDWDQPTQTYDIARAAPWQTPTEVYGQGGADAVAQTPAGAPDEAPPEASAGSPTELLAGSPTELYAVPSPVDPAVWPGWQTPPEASLAAGTAEALVPGPAGIARAEDAALAAAAPAAGLDDLFGEGRFQPVEEPVVARPGRAVASAGISRQQIVLLCVAGGLVFLLLLALMFVLGVRAGTREQPTPATTATEAATGTAAIGPLDPGTYAWTELLGGECVDPFVSAWESEYTVVDCDQVHTGQLVARGSFDDDADLAAAGYPGADELEDEAASLCTSAKVLDYGAAEAYQDLQLATSYAADESDWDAGDHDYLCFVSRADGDDIAGSLAVATD